MESIEIEGPMALRPNEIKNAYQNKDTRTIRLIERYRPFNESYAEKNQLPTRQYRCERRVKITTQQFIGDEKTVLQQLDTEIHRLSTEVPYPVWVKEACGMSPCEVLDFNLSLYRISSMLRGYFPAQYTESWYESFHGEQSGSWARTRL